MNEPSEDATAYVYVDDPRWGSPHTLTIVGVTASAVTVRRNPPYPGMVWFLHGGGQTKLPDRPTQGYDRPSMEVTLRNMRENGHPALPIFEHAYARMCELA